MILTLDMVFADLLDSYSLIWFFRIYLTLSLDVVYLILTFDVVLADLLDLFVLVSLFLRPEAVQAFRVHLLMVLFTLFQQFL